MAAAVAGLDALGSAEAQLQRLFVTLQQRELAVPAETRPNNVTITYDTEALTATFTAGAVPITLTPQANGDVTVIATAYPVIA